MFLTMHGTLLALCLALCQVSGKKEKDKWVIIETDGKAEKTPAKQSGSLGSGQDFSLRPSAQNVGTVAKLRCESKSPFKKCQFKDPAGKVTWLGTRCGGSMYSDDNKRDPNIVKLCLEDKSLVDKTDTVCGIAIKKVSAAYAGLWSCEYKIGKHWITEEILLNVKDGRFEMETPVSADQMIQKEEIVLTPNNLLTILPNIGSEYKIEFELYITEYGRYAFNSIILFAVDQGNKGYLKYGDRVPGIWLHNDKKLYICSAVSGNANTCATPGITLKKWTSIEICQHVIGGKLTFEVLINGKSIYQTTNTKPCLFKNVKVFAGDPFYEAQKGKIRNLYFSTTDENNRGACVVDYTPTPVPSSGFIVQSPLELKRDHLITVLPFLGSQYKITFDLYISSYLSHHWSSVIHFTQNGESQEYGDRNPAIWISHEKKFHCTSAINGQLNYHTDSRPNYPVKTWIPIVVSQTLVDKKFVYEVKINGETVITIVNKLPQQFEAVKVYAGDPWFPAQAGKINNLKVLTQDDRECMDQCLAV